jgi:hypothetical protein
MIWMQGVIDDVFEVIKVHLMHKPMHAGVMCCLLMIRCHDNRRTYGSGKTRSSTD